jgi:hypothetical protein
MSEYLEQQIELMKKMIASQNMALVHADSSNIQYIQDQTPEMCMLAVKRDSSNIQYIQDQTPEMCMLAVKRDSSNIKYVKNQTPELIEEVEKDKTRLKFKECSDFIRALGIAFGCGWEILATCDSEYHNYRHSNKRKFVRYYPYKYHKADCAGLGSTNLENFRSQKSYNEVY